MKYDKLHGQVLNYYDWHEYNFFQIGCCVEYIGSDISRSVAQCNVQNCTTIEISDSGAEALECYQSRLRDNSMLDGCHRHLLTTLTLVTSIIYHQGQFLTQKVERACNWHLAKFKSIG